MRRSRFACCDAKTPADATSLSLSGKTMMGGLELSAFAAKQSYIMMMGYEMGHFRGLDEMHCD
jgi:hypothetical protein